MNRILVIGSSGFVGGRVARALLADGYAVRCLARNPAKVRDLAALGGEVVRGDPSDLASLQRALESVDAAYIAVYTLSPQPGNTAGKYRFAYWKRHFAPHTPHTTRIAAMSVPLDGTKVPTPGILGTSPVIGVARNRSSARSMLTTDVPPCPWSHVL